MKAIITAQAVHRVDVRIIQGIEVDSFASVDFDDLSVYIDNPEQMEQLAKKLEAGAKTLLAMQETDDE